MAFKLALGKSQDSLRPSLILMSGFCGARRGPYHYLLDKIHYRYWLAQSQQAGLRADVARQLIAEVIEMTGFVINQVRSSITGPFPMDVAESIFTGMEMQVKKLAAQIES
jgi:hypothetical protein